MGPPMPTSALYCSLMVLHDWLTPTHQQVVSKTVRDCASLSWPHHSSLKHEHHSQQAFHSEG